MGAGGNGGGIFSKDGSLTIENSTISGNQAAQGGTAGSGGGIAATDVHVLGSTITDNEALAGAYGPRGGNGGGISATRIRIDNSILAGNTAGGMGADCYGEIRSANYDLIGDPVGCVVPEDVVGMLVGEAPHLGVLQDNGGPTQTHALCIARSVPDPACEAPSPAIDAASREQCLPTDQRGAPRPFGAVCDMGAYESGPMPPGTCVGDCDDSGVVTVDELVRCVDIALGILSLSSCPACDCDGSGSVTIDCIIRGVQAILTGCPETF